MSDIVERLRDIASWRPDGDDNPGFDECAEAADEIEALRTAVRLLVDHFHSDTPMGPNVVDLPDVRWRILPPNVADAVQRAINAAPDSAGPIPERNNA